MPHFTYKGLQDDGTVIEGEMDANVQQEAYRQMEFHGLRPIGVHEVQPGEAPGANGVAAEPMKSLSA
jgi:type II secretory pathway component PulF